MTLIIVPIVNGLYAKTFPALWKFHQKAKPDDPLRDRLKGDLSSMPLVIMATPVVVMHAVRLPLGDAVISSSSCPVLSLH